MRWHGLAVSVTLCSLVWGVCPPPVQGQDPWTAEVTAGLLDMDSLRFQDAVQHFEAAVGHAEDEPLVRAEILAYLVDARLSGELPGLVEDLWEYVQSGDAVGALDKALAGLQTRAYQEQRSDLLVLVATSLSRQFYNPGGFLRSSAASQLREFEGDAVIGEGVRQLLRWHGPNVWGLQLTDSVRVDTVPVESGAANVGAELLRVDTTYVAPFAGCDGSRLTQGRFAGRWSWWDDQVTSSDDSAALSHPDALTRSDAARALLRMLGNWYAQRGGAADLARAETYLCMSAVVYSTAIVTMAFRDLLWTYVDGARPELIRALDTATLYQDQFHKKRFGDGETLGDSEYLQPIEDALGFHPWYRNPRNWAIAAAIIGGGSCLSKFIICDGGGTGSASISIAIP